MYTREQLQGLLLSIARPELTIYPSNVNRTGYVVRMRIMFRAKEDFLMALRRTFEQYNIDSNYKESEGPNRDKPIVIVGRRRSIRAIVNLLPNLPTSHASWNDFIGVLRIMEEGGHLDDEGMLEIISLVEGDDKQ